MRKASATADASSAASFSSAGAFWERLWRTGGIQAVALFFLAYLIYGHQPQVGATADSLVTFYDGNRTQILIAAFLSGMALLNLLWFAAAIGTALADRGQDGWGAAVTASSAALGGLFFLLLAVVASLASTVAGNPMLALGLHDFSWSLVVVSSFPRAMLIMAGTFGLWRAGMISNAHFAAGVAVVVLVLLGGTTWQSTGVWAPDGRYSRLVSPFLGLVWILAVSRVLLNQPRAIRAQW